MIYYVVFSYLIMFGYMINDENAPWLIFWAAPVTLPMVIGAILSKHDGPDKPDTLNT